MPRLTTLRPGVAIAELRTAPPPDKVADPELLKPEHRAFRAAVLERAGFRCEYVEEGKRCWRSEANGHRMFADHIVERSDGGALYDPANGRCLCGVHHASKTKAEQQRRLAASPGPAAPQGG